MPGPQKIYSSYLPQIPCTILQRKALHLLANARGITITDLLRQSWESFCELPENHALLNSIAAAQEANQFHLIHNLQTEKEKEND